ncbi:bacteriocin [Prochlorococcus sp. MIT 1201]|uniref:bacteriocin n=1 Tax=Prochlorococcus sp. MIT 1201 TaxID=3082535 RepID=UPI0039A52246
MTDPKENEELNEELSTDELKSVSGGVVIRDNDRMLKGNRTSITWREDGANRLSNGIDAKGSGSGMTVQDWNRANKSSGFLIVDEIEES